MTKVITYVTTSSSEETPEDLVGIIKTGGLSVIVELDQPFKGVKYVLINDETKGRIQIMNENDGQLKIGVKVIIKEAEMGGEALRALIVEPLK